jgi:hypothetical protein
MASLLEYLKIPLAEFKRVSVIVMIVTNLVPIFGVVFLDWQVFIVMSIFWTENVVIGIFNVLKMAFAPSANTGKQETKSTLIPFFCIHYGIFTLIHGILVFAIFGGIFEHDNLITGITDSYKALANYPFAWTVLALALSHAVSYVVNYIARGEWKKTSLEQLMVQPYIRVIILHLTILFGGFLIMILNSPAVGLVLLIILKTYVDIKSHLKQHSFFTANSSP